MALMVLAASGGCHPIAYHVDHGLRPGSAGEADVVRQAAERFGVGFVALKVSVAPGPNLEARARIARRSVLPPGSATGHTADDLAETVLINFLRGAGASGLAGMRPGPAHPLLGIRRSETRRLCAELGLEVVEDPSNADPTFLRNRVRHELLPLLCEAAGRDVVPVICRQAALLGEETDYLDAASASIDPTDAVALASAPPVLARRAVRSWLRAMDPEQHPPDSASIERVLAVAARRALACEVSGGLRVRRSAGKLIVEPARGRGNVSARDR